MLLRLNVSWHMHLFDPDASEFVPRRMDLALHDCDHLTHRRTSHHLPIPARTFAGQRTTMALTTLLLAAQNTHRTGITAEGPRFHTAIKQFRHLFNRLQQRQMTEDARRDAIDATVYISSNHRYANAVEISSNALVPADGSTTWTKSCNRKKRLFRPMTDFLRYPMIQLCDLKALPSLLKSVLRIVLARVLSCLQKWMQK